MYHDIYGERAINTQEYEYILLIGMWFLIS